MIQQKLTAHHDWNFVQAKLDELSRSQTQTKSDCDEAKRILQDLDARLSEAIGDFYATFHQDYHEQHQALFCLSHEYLLQEALKHKVSVVFALKEYANVLSQDNSTRKEAIKRLTKTPALLQEHIQWISLMFPVITCGLYSIRNMLP